jgi:hypothetical protein
MEQFMATQLTTLLLTSGNMSIPKILLIVGIDQIKRILVLLVDKFIERINKFDYNTGICVIAFIKRIFSKLCKNFLFNRQRRDIDDTVTPTTPMTLVDAEMERHVDAVSLYVILRCSLKICVM